ncbi:MAG: efflux RND transporter periplasmic adaptor subunit [Acidobacteriaceae bacterium]|nr:efflux RND transporter periplasmic adaptor subunit [Acidobacteriaceae bacterium]MBV8569170.1 efflux RND transporter periplasmic adaptor subunit [Acidobacteriaceae bacterium]
MTVEEQKTNDSKSIDATAASRQSGNLRGLLVVLALGAIVLAGMLYSGITGRAKADTALNRETEQLAIPTVSVIRPNITEGAEEVVLPGNVQAYVDTPIWARASGYLKTWHVDIGAHVKKGELLAEIESPEVDQQLQQAKADLTTAQANLKLAQITAERYNNLFKTDSVSKQELDNAVQDAAAKTATANSAQANASRLEQLVSYENVYAPFDGVITARNVDTGALVDADTNTPGKELFHLASTATLRVYVNVPEIYSRAAKPGVTSYLTLSEFPGRRFKGTIVRNAEAIDVASRTLLVEVDVNNPTGELLPGSYTSVHLKLPSKVQALSVPSNALLFRSEGLRVAVVKNGQTQLVPVTLGRDFGNEVEVVSGLNRNDAVIVNPSDSIQSGEQVRLAQPQEDGE